MRCRENKWGNDILVTVKGPQSVVAVKDEKWLFHLRGDLLSRNGEFQFFPGQKTININPFYTIPIMQVFYLMSFNGSNKIFDTLQELMKYYDTHSSIYTHYIFSIPLIGYFRRDELPDVNDTNIREKYGLGVREVIYLIN